MCYCSPSQSVASGLSTAEHCWALQVTTLSTGTACIGYLLWCCDHMPEKRMEGSQFEGYSTPWRESVGKQRETSQSGCGHSQEAKLTGDRKVDWRILSEVDRLSSFPLSCVGSAIAVAGCSVGPGQSFFFYQREQNYLVNESTPSSWAQ